MSCFFHGILANNNPRDYLNGLSDPEFCSRERRGDRFFPGGRALPPDARSLGRVAERYTFADRKNWDLATEFQPWKVGEYEWT